MNNLLPLYTDRLILKKTSTADIDMILKMDKQEMTQKYLGGIKNKTKEERLTFLSNRTSSITVCLKDETPIGFVGLKINNNEAELSYIFDYDYCNKGYCTEACKKIIDIAFNEFNINKIIADTVEGNDSSRRVLEKLGFEYLDTSTKDNIKFLNYILSKR